MRRHPFALGAALLGVAMAGVGFASGGGGAPSLGGVGEGVDKIDRYEKRGKGQRNRRGKGKRNPPRARPNRLIVSARVRRKHRKARKHG